MARPQASVKTPGKPITTRRGFTFRIACALLFAPSAAPEPIIAHVYGATARILKKTATVKLLATEGTVAVGNTPDEFGALVRAEIAEWTKLIREMTL